VSNLVGERDRARWDLRGAVRTSTDAAIAALTALAQHPAFADLVDHRRDSTGAVFPAARTDPSVPRHGPGRGKTT
jgi:hypothetical protein